MSNALMFDRYRVIKKYKEAGLTEAQAELYAEALVIAVEDQVATKQDLREVEVTLKQDLMVMENRLLLRMGLMAGGCTAVLGILIALF